MKNFYRLFPFNIVTVILFTFSLSAEANWLKRNNNTSIHSDKSDIQNSENFKNSNKTDSLPDGVTEDWLNDLRDEKGNRIKISEDPNHEQGDPEVDSFQRKIFNGQSTGSFFGQSVSSAGDVNGDGYSDFIVGASGYSSNTGRSYIYYGGTSINTIADVTMDGQVGGSNFGYSVSSAGDVNGDGYSDVIVGAYGYAGNRGRVYIYYGGASMNSAADLIITGEVSGDRFGWSVSSAGDVNGDGYSDIIAGTFGFNAFTGRSYIYFGGVSMNDIADVTMTGAAVNYNLGISVSTAGDVNSDGYSDVIVGADGYSSNTGRAYVYFGGTSMNNTADVVLTGESTDDLFGNKVKSAGDVNGDGYSDVMIGAYGYSNTIGRVYIYYGGGAMNNAADVVMTGEAIGDFFGASVSSAGDINGDGYSDIIVGARGFLSSTGKAYIYFGGVTMNNTADESIMGEGTGSFGASVSDAGDVNGDGYTDIIISAINYNSNTGRVFFYNYFMKNEIVADQIMYGETVSDRFGTSVSNAGDVNGDGYSDVIVGANYYFSGTGRAYIFLGGPNMDNVADLIMQGSASSNFGSSVSSAGDVNGDGFSDVIVGAWGYNSGTGRAYIYYGGPSLNNTPDVTMTGESTSNYFGISVSSARDVNGDGFSDVIIGASGFNSNLGRAYIYYGGSSMNNVSDVTFFGQAASFFGNSVSGAGDINGDGYHDVIVGAYNSSSIGSQEGRVNVYYGGNNMNNTPDLSLYGESNFDYFGRSVSEAGDVNDDGFSDFIVGAINAGSNNEGKAYIFYGGISIINNPNVIMTGEVSDDNFGFSVSGAGDINGDGYDDVIIGALQNDESGTDAGKSYIYLGGISMNNTADVIMKGISEESRLGSSVSSAGDLNGDGYGDIIVGSTNADTAGLITGASYIFKGSAISTKPIFNYVKDVPNDQGGYVNLKWARSGYDVIGNNLVTGYSVLRSFPPSGGNFSWQEVSNVTAQKTSFYTFVDNTPFDSTSNNSGTMFYRIKANTNNPSQFWLSGILSGRSIDNIAPLMVSPFTAAASGSNVNLNWGGNSAPDLLNYVLFRSTNPTIDPYTETPLATSVTTAFTDTDPLIGLYYYFIVAQDIHGNYSPVATAVSPFFTINLTMFIEGFYNDRSNTQVSDTLNTFLRNTSSPYNIVDNSKAVVSTLGKADLNFSNAANGNYYLSIKHRNSIETWSSSGITVTDGSSVNFNLTYLITQAYGSNQIQIDASPLRFGIYSGDVNQDGTIDIADGSLIDNDAFNFVSGYVPTDVNGDGVVDVADAVFADNNGFNFVSKITP